MYAAVHHDLGARRLLSQDTVARVSQIQAAGIDLAGGIEARFGVVFQIPNPPRLLFGSARAFGHDGAGGSLGFCDPHYDLAVGYLTKRIPLPGGVDARAVTLTQVLRSCVGPA
jgi:CubicO group peptidase (beta-lactamase class C family)